MYICPYTIHICTHTSKNMHMQTCTMQHIHTHEKKREERGKEREKEKEREERKNRNRRPMVRPLLCQYGQGIKYEDNEVEKWVEMQSL